MNFRTIATSLFCLCATGAWGQEDQSVTFRFDVDEAAAAEVGTSAELVEFMKSSVRIEAGVSMDTPMWVDLRGYAGDPARESYVQLIYSPDLRVALKEGQSVSGIAFGDAVAESHGEDFPDDGDIWDEQDIEGWTAEDAWDRLLEEIEAGLAASSDDFGLLADGAHHQLRISRVVSRNFNALGNDGEAMFAFSNCCYAEHGIVGPALVLRPELGIDSGRFPYDSDIRYDVDVLIVHLESTAPPAAPPAPEAAEMARMLTARGCQALAPMGASEISVGDTEYSGGSAFMRGPNGEIMVVIGAIEDGEPQWCLTLGSAVPVEPDGSYDVVDPATLMQDRVSVSAAFETFGDDPVLYWSTGGVVRFRIGEIAEGRLMLEGPLVAGDGSAETVQLRGWFEAELMQ